MDFKTFKEEVKENVKDRVFEKVDKFVARQKENSQKHVAEKGTEGIQKPKKSHEMSL